MSTLWIFLLDFGDIVVEGGAGTWSCVGAGCDNLEAC